MSSQNSFLYSSRNKDSQKCLSNSEEKDRKIHQETLKLISIFQEDDSSYDIQNNTQRKKLLQVEKSFTDLQTSNYSWYKTQINRQKKQIERKANQMTNALQLTKEQQLKDEINEHRDTINMLQKHLQNLRKKYKQKSVQANNTTEKYIQVKQNYDHLQEKYLNLQAKYAKKEQQLISNYQKQIQRINCQFSQLQSKLRYSITQLQLKIKNMQIIQKNKQQEYQSVKCILTRQIQERLFKQQENLNQITSLKTFIIQRDQIIVELKQMISQKSKQLTEKKSCISSLNKSLKQVNNRLIQTEAQGKKLLMKQKANTKRAMDGLQMTRKYSQLELNKSRKKQKIYLLNQKQLIGKIKQICKDQSMIDTTDKTSRKSQIKSLNTTLRDSKPVIQNFSPLVSNFIVEDQNVRGFSPIQNIKQHKKQNSRHHEKNIVQTFNGHNSSPLIKTTKSKQRIIIETPFANQIISAGTPCFEFRNNQKLFKAIK